MELLCLEKENEAHSIADPVFLDDDRVLKNLLFIESKCKLDKCLFKSVQTNINAEMRKEVAIWLLEVCIEEQCEEKVFPMAMSIMDRFLAIIRIQKSQLQLLAAVCLLLSTKVVQNKFLSIEKLVMFTDYSVTCEEIRGWELLVLSELSWDISLIVPNDFLNLVLRRLDYMNSNKKSIIKKHTELLISLCASEYKFSHFLPSTIICACLALVLEIHCYRDTFEEVLKNIQQIIEIDFESIEQTVEILEKLISVNRLNISINNKIQNNRKRPLRSSFNNDNLYENDLFCIDSKRLNRNKLNLDDKCQPENNHQTRTKINHLSHDLNQFDLKKNSNLHKNYLTKDQNNQLNSNSLQFNLNKNNIHNNQINTDCYFNLQSNKLVKNSSVQVANLPETPTDVKDVLF